jgi:hypothetical protein
MEHHRSPAPGSGRSRKEPKRGLIPPENLSSYVIYNTIYIVLWINDIDVLVPDGMIDK